MTALDDRPIGAPDQSYPAAPWRLSGVFWAGLFRAAAAPAPAPGLRLLPGMRMVVALIAYREGTLRYNELLVGLPARRGLLPGLDVRHLWVDSAASCRGGRAIWGLPKRLAQFTWDDSSVEVTDEQGLIARLLFERRRLLLPALPLLLPAFGRHAAAPTLLLVRSRARLARGNLTIGAWGQRFAPRPVGCATLALAGGAFNATFPAPWLLGE